MEASRKLTIPVIGLMLIALAAVLSLVYLLHDLDKKLALQRMEIHGESVKIANKIDREARNFRYHLFLYSINSGMIDLNDVRRSFEVFRSRIEDMDTENLLEKNYLQLEGADEALRLCEKMLPNIDRLLSRFLPGDNEGRDEILAHLDPVVQSFSEVAGNASESYMLLHEKNRHSFKITGRLTIFLVSAIFLSGAALFVIMLRNQYRLGELTHTLEDKVQERTTALKGSNQSLKKMSQAIEQSPISVIICNLEGNIAYVNPRFVEVTGYTSAEAVGQNPKFIQSGLTSDQTYRQMWQVAHSGGVWKGEICNKRKNGELFWELVSFSPIKDEDDRPVGYLAIKEDISQQKVYEEQLLKQANYDSLTGLPNRMLAMDRLKHAILQGHRRGDAVALLFVDLDNFKQINDTLGHECGDYVLKKAAERFHGCLRDCDTAARFGGDEFLLILSELQGREDVKPIVKRVLDAFSLPFEVEGKRFLVTASIGVAMCPEDSVSSSELLKKSDNAMYQAKNMGKNNYRFYEKDRF